MFFSELILRGWADRTIFHFFMKSHPELCDVFYSNNIKLKSSPKAYGNHSHMPQKDQIELGRRVGLVNYSRSLI